MTTPNTALSLFVQSYVRQAIRTAKFFNHQFKDTRHVALGLTTEAGEYATSIKRIQVYNKDAAPLVKNIAEELGDYVWYLALWAHLRDISLWLLTAASLDDAVAELALGDDMTTSGALVNFPALGAWMEASMIGEGKEPSREDTIAALEGGMTAFRLACRAFDLDPVAVLAQNLAKLRARFPDAYSDEAAEARADKGGLDATVS